MAEKRPEPMTFHDVSAAVEVSHNEKRKFLIEALDDALAECVAKAARYQSKSVLSMKVAVNVAGDKAAIAAVIDTALPRPAATTVGAYVDSAGRLCMDDPRQENLFAIAKKEGE